MIHIGVRAGMAFFSDADEPCTGCGESLREVRVLVSTPDGTFHVECHGHGDDTSNVTYPVAA